MKNEWRVVFCVFGFFSLFFINAGKAQEPAAYNPRRLLVKPNASATAAQVGAAHAAVNAKVHRQYPEIKNWQVLELPAGLDVKKAMEHYRRTGLFELVQPDYVVHVLLAPNDPAYQNGTLWAMNNTGQNGGTADADIDAPEAWDTRTAATNIIVAVIDTGVRYTHEDLAGNMWVNPGEIAGNGIDDDANGYVDDVHGINAITGAGDPWDDHFHGTHCSGTIGGIGNNGKGVAGVCWAVKIMGCKFLNAGGSGNTSDAIECINYARVKGAKIMSNSWGGGPYDAALRDVIISARNAGIIFVAAAGNSGADSDVNPTYPAAYDVDNIVSVAATDRNDLLASFSNYGLTSVDLGAPGVEIYSSYNTSDSAYGTLSGTSMATPHVAGALALVAAQFPGQTYSQLIWRVLGNVDAITSLDGKCATGGRLNVWNALTLAPRAIANFTANPSSGEPPLTVYFTNTTIGATTNLVWDFGDGSTASGVPNPTHTYTNLGTYNVTLTAYSTGGVSTRTRQILVAKNYTMSPAPFAWVDPTAMTPLALTDDSYSPQTLPFAFVFYGQSNTTLYVGSNGLLGFNPSGMNAYINSDMPNTAAPNAIVAPYWDDLNPGMAGSVHIGTIGSAPNRTVVVSWVGVPHYSDATALMTFQTLLSEGSGDIKMQFQEVQPGNLSYGAGRSATVGIENQTGALARKYSYLGSTLLSNQQAILFSIAPPVAPGTLAVTPADGLSSAGYPGGPFSPSSKTYTLANTGGFAIDWTASASAAWVSLSATDGSLAPGATTAVQVSINSNANALPAGSYTGAVAFANTTNGRGNTTRPVSLSVVGYTLNPPGSLTASFATGPKVILNWTDTSVGEDGFAIERAEKSGRWGAFSQIATVGPNVTTYTDNSVAGNRQYRYRVRAYRGGLYSGYSNVAQIRTR
jgi:subtilisin family serine protease